MYATERAASKRHTQSQSQSHTKHHLNRIKAKKDDSLFGGLSFSLYSFFVIVVCVYVFLSAQLFSHS